MAIDRGSPPPGSSRGGHPRIRAADAHSVPSYDPENQVTTPDLLPSAVTPLASQAAVARALGLSRKTVTVWKRRGNLVMAGDLVDLNATAAQLLRTHADGPMLVTRLAELSAETVTPPAMGNNKSVTPPVTPLKVVTPRPTLAPVAEAVVSFAERIAREGGHCAWEAGITRQQAEVADRLYRQGLIIDAAEFLDQHFAAPAGGDWMAEPVWQNIRADRPDWSALRSQRDWEISEGMTPGNHSEIANAEG